MHYIAHSIQYIRNNNNNPGKITKYFFVCDLVYTRINVNRVILAYPYFFLTRLFNAFMLMPFSKNFCLNFHAITYFGKFILIAKRCSFWTLIEFRKWNVVKCTAITYIHPHIFDIASPSIIGRSARLYS